MGRKQVTPLSILTWNIYAGADVKSIFVPSLKPIQQRVTEVFEHFLKTRIPARIQMIVREIQLKKPDLIGLQEVVRWQLVRPNLMTADFDFAKLLLTNLEQRGLPYVLAAQNRNASVGLPDSRGNLIRLTDRDIILIRKGSGLEITRRQEANFKTNLIVPLESRLVKIRRGWSSVDVRTEGQVFRMINTHLDPDVPIIREIQAAELLKGPAYTSLPLIIAGDFNAAPDSATYKRFLDAGFRDGWSMAGAGSGFTCCQDEELLNGSSGLNERVDYVLFKNGWIPIKAELVGASQRERTEMGLWPSDHAGVYTELRKGSSSSSVST